MIPQTRTDLFLAKITGEDVALPVPQTRFELYLANIAGESYELPAPNSRATLYLAKILGQDVALPVPQTRSELYLAAIAGMEVQLPAAPTTREEWYLAKWAEDAGYVTITGNPVSFQAVAAKLRQLQIAFSPVQDLHGYDAPWPAGGGKNLFNPDDTFTLAGYGTFIAGEVVAGQQYTVSFVDAEAGSSYAQRFYVNGSWVSAGTSITGTALKTGYSFTAVEGATKFAINGYSEGAKMQLEKGSTATSYAPYENECPISGWDGVTVWRTGKNLLALPIVPYNTVYPYSSINTFDPEDYMWFKAGTYCLSYIADASNRYLIKLFDKNGNALRDDAYNPAPGATYFNATYKGWYTGANLNAGAIQRQIVLIEDCYVRICRSFGNPDISFTDCQFELGTTASEYQPYNPSSLSISISFGSTVYSGTLDVLTGVVTVTKRKIAITSADDVYAFSTNSSGYYRARYNNYGSWFKNHSAGIYSVGTVTTASNAYNFARPNTFFTENTSVYVMPPSGVTTVQDYKAWLDSIGGVEAVVELKTPTTIQLTPQEVESLAGDNTMWTDANGDLTVEYRKDGNVSDAEALSLLLGGRYTPAQDPDDVPDREALRIITGR